ncbi:non-heme iron oxygenase ferredoxin subunit [Sinomonas sp. JGH33]|uniref:Non-heme iron oxygenase ferredoxin subunit n=1 Tax=Sinomonas terricola TaxID=3110330 RepID=A0ABU5T5W4_9MICC|nr:non-heme iron oxygenase ferredoxin subunit [Sinomonas sp. JGH33]MEA5455049.1 non-heme iron oxygenase ferredoxin subunit [Sinomonas sp. JGH33]
MSDGIDVGRLDEIDEGTARVIEPEESGFDEPIAVFHTETGCVFALDDTCTHEEASLAEGWIEGDTVECPLHSSSFDLRTGRVLCLPATQSARTHKVEVADGRVVLYPGVDAEDAARVGE